MSFHMSVADNVNSIRKWHHKKHQGPWHECVWEPCHETEAEFRRAWDR